MGWWTPDWLSHSPAHWPHSGASDRLVSTVLWGQGAWGCPGVVRGAGWEEAWHIPGSPRLSCRECHLHGEMPVACLGTWVPLE